MNVSTVITVVITILIVLILESIIVMFTVLILYKRDRVNKIDVLIYELSKNGWQTRIEKGRFEHDSVRGRTLYTCKFLPWSIKDKLGYNFSDNDVCPSLKGFFGKRYFLACAGKDGLFSPLKAEKKSKDVKLTPGEEKTFKDVCSKLIYPVNIDQNPETLNLTPILHEQLRFKLDVTQDTQDIYRNADREFAKTLMKLAIYFAFGVLVFAVVVIVILITQGGTIAEAAVNVVPATLPPG